MRPLRVFLCHASQDKPAVRKLHRYLKQHGIEPWLDEIDLLPGENWDVEISRALNASDVILVCLSKNSINKEGYVQKEISFALDKALEKPEGTIFIIPAKLEDCEVPKRLNRYQWVDLFRPDSNKRLLLGLNKRVASLGSDVLPVILEDTPVVRLPKNQAIRKILLGAGGLFAFAILTLVAWRMAQLPTSPEVTQSPSATQTPFVVSSTPTKTPMSATSTATTVPTPTLGIGSTMIGEKGETLVYVPAGEFTMGHDSQYVPVHTVYLDAYWIDQTEVTNKQYKACVDAGMCELPSSIKSYTHPSYYGNPEFDDYPVIYINWDKANRYCEVWAGGDLPTEAQWEKAARGVDARTYPWGNDAPNNTLLNYNQDIGDTTEVGMYPSGASIYDAYDMAGNVWEWLNDWYGVNYYNDSASSNNPVGPESGQVRVLRGGSWNEIVSNYVRSTNRGWNGSEYASSGIGFRCARSP